MHDDDLYGVQGIEDEVLVWISQKGIVVCPLLSFFFSFFLFSFFFFFFCLYGSFFFSLCLFSFFLFFGGLNGSFYLTLICPLWDLLILSSWGSFPHFRGNTLYF